MNIVLLSSEFNLKKFGFCTVDIISRYNHTVNNPNATYGNDLDKIVPGLTQSFTNLLQKRGLSFNNSNIEKINLPNYVVASDGKYYKFNTEIEGIYYCPGNIVIENGKAIKFKNPEKLLLIDYFIFDLEKRTLKPYSTSIIDSFPNDIVNIKKIQIKKDKTTKSRTILIYKIGYETPITITINNDNEIIEYTNNYLSTLDDNFLSYNQKLTYLELPNLTSCGSNFLKYNLGIHELNFPKLLCVGDHFIFHNMKINKLNLPNLTTVGIGFLYNNQEITELNLPKLTEAGNYFLPSNMYLNELYLPVLNKVGDNFLCYNRVLKQLELPKLTEIGDDFLYLNVFLNKLKLPKLEKIGDNFLQKNLGLESLILPNVTQIGDDFLLYNALLKKILLPKLTTIGHNFLPYNQNLKHLDLPNLKQVGYNFLYDNKTLIYINVPKLESIGVDFLPHRPILREDLLLQIEKNSSHIITSKSLSQFDKFSNLCNSEILHASQQIYSNQKNNKEK